MAFRTDKNIVVLNSGQIFLPITATLDDVKKVMEDNSICQDVFITKTGSKDEAVEGWNEQHRNRKGGII